MIKFTIQLLPHLGLLGALWIPAALAAQQTQLSGHEKRADVDTRSINERLQQIDEIQLNLQEQWPQESGTMLDVEPPQPFESILRQLRHSELETTRQVHEISSRIRFLAERERERLMQLALKSAEAGDWPQAEMNSNVSELDRTAPNANPESIPGEPVGATAQPAVNDAAANMPGNPQPESKPFDFSVAGQRILSEPPDRLALANNLFQTGQYELALQIYQGLRQQLSTSTDQLWVDYQIATCWRRLDRTDEAQKQLREIANRKSNDPNTTPIIAMAQWWLDVLEKKMQYESNLQIMDDYINQQTMEQMDVPSANRSE